MGTYYIFEDRINEPSANSTRSWIQESYTLCRSINQDTVVIDRNFRPRQAVVSVCSHGSLVGVTSLRGGPENFRVQATNSPVPIFKFNREIASTKFIYNKAGKESIGFRAD
jgi:hypothetical protein